MASTANRIGALAQRSAFRIRPRCAHLTRPVLRAQAFHDSPLRRADKNEGESPNQSQPGPEASSPHSETASSESVFPELRTRVSGASSDSQKPFQPERAFNFDKELTPEELAEAQAYLKGPSQEHKQLLNDLRSELSITAAGITREFRQMAREQHEIPSPPEKQGVMTPGDFASEIVPDDTYEGDDVTSLAHMELDQHRELRQYMRVMAWEMPKLRKLAKPFEPPSSDRPLRFRYTTYMGESHPAENKVVLEFCTIDLPLKPVERLKLIKLVGSRYNPQTDLVKISCESFSSQAQNKRYLGDLVGSLIQVAKGKGSSPEAKDSFADVPVDFRHVRWKQERQFPEAWKITPERQQILQQQRAQLAAADRRHIQDGGVVDGMQAVRESFQVRRPAPIQQRAGASLQGRVDKIKAGARGAGRQPVRI